MKRGGTFKNDQNSRILKWHEKVKEGTSRGDTTTNLHNFSSRIFSVPTEKLEKPDLGRPGRKDDKNRSK